ncbi:MAG: ROK family protein [Candidatus Wallbacteria bacterium]|nr:ROK family protein [Candidatus Wallbacteria bacterium]
MKFPPVLDRNFIPAVLWRREFDERAASSDKKEQVLLALTRSDGTVYRHDTSVPPHIGSQAHDNIRHIERLIKFLLWQKGGDRVLISGPEQLVSSLSSLYAPCGRQEFDSSFIGKKIFGKPLEIVRVQASDMPAARDISAPLGRHLDGCRIGFDLGGSDRKCASLIDGEVIFSEEIKWSPYFEKDPNYHIKGIQHSIDLAASKLPRVDAIGGSAAGIYIDNEVRGGSLYRGLSEQDFDKHIRRFFIALGEKWGVPLEIVNDGEVAALAGAMSLNDNAVLGISFGTSLASGFVTPAGNITSWLNELAFVPVDYRSDAPVDEWSGDRGCGVQYFSQQAVARLSPIAGFDFPADLPYPELLVAVQEAMKKGDPRAEAIFRTIGSYFGYTLALLSEFYDYRNLLIMGRVTSEQGGEIINDQAGEVLKQEFPELSYIRLCTPDEKNKRHGQAIAAASLPGRAR